jgi:hypothetical protein
LPSWIEVISIVRKSAPGRASHREELAFVLISYRGLKVLAYQNVDRLSVRT